MAKPINKQSPLAQRTNSMGLFFKWPNFQKLLYLSPYQGFNPKKKKKPFLEEKDF